MLNTQSSSKPRLKNNTYQDSDIQKLFQLMDAPTSLETFKQLCEDFVQAGGGKQSRKDDLINAIRASRSKAEACTKATNFMLAGEGKGV
jgi:hypothetical protein